jgi:hypothetical protein
MTHSFTSMSRFELTDHVSTKMNRDGKLTNDAEPVLPQFLGQGIFVYRFEKAAAELIVDLEECSNDCLSDVLVEEFMYYPGFAQRRSANENPAGYHDSSRL